MQLAQFKPYVSKLESLLLNSVCNNLKKIDREQISIALDGEPNSEMRRLVDLDIQKLSGAFFTGKKLAERVCKFTFDGHHTNLSILDPACGVGDLLIAYARRLPLSSDFESTLSNWGKQLYGYDIYPEFIQLAKIRLALLAIIRGVPINSKDTHCISNMFPFIQTGDGFLSVKNLVKKTHILINPPYSLIKTPSDCSWTKGIVSSAAIFIENCLSLAPSGSYVSAILPDVLRTGTRYQKWRETVSSLAEINKTEIIGQFDKWTDIDVFLAHFTVKQKKENKKKNPWSLPRINSKNRVTDLFDVHVGPVVPHRDLQKGPRCIYILARELPKNGVVKKFCHYRRFSGKLFLPPFIAVRRTSRPDEKNRIVSTIITGKNKVAVENHLLVLSPCNKTLRNCKKLVVNLQCIKTRKWLDKRIRCRHLTVSALKELPLWNEFYK